MKISAKTSVIFFIVIVLVTFSLSASAASYWYVIVGGNGPAECNIGNVERSKAAAETHGAPYIIFKTHTAFKEYLQTAMNKCKLVDAAEPLPSSLTNINNWTRCAGRGEECAATVLSESYICPVDNCFAYVGP